MPEHVPSRYSLLAHGGGLEHVVHVPLLFASYWTYWPLGHDVVHTFAYAYASPVCEMHGGSKPLASEQGGSRGWCAKTPQPVMCVHWQSRRRRLYQRTILIHHNIYMLK